MDPTSALISLDVDQALLHKSGQKLLNICLAHSARLFQTKRGHAAIQLDREAWKYIKKTMRLAQAEGLDGLTFVSFEVQPSARSTT